MIVLGLDTSTPSTVAAVLLEDGRSHEERDDPPPGERPRHAERLLGLAEDALRAVGAGWGEVGRLAVGVGPGGFTGLRIGVATARGIAQAHGLPVVPVGSLEALASAAARSAAGRPILAAIDARRGEVFAAAWLSGACLLEPAALRPEALADEIPGLPAPPLAIGDGAVRYRSVLEDAGAEVPPDSDRRHLISGIELCALGAAGTPTDREALAPDYRREPDAKPPSPR